MNFFQNPVSANLRFDEKGMGRSGQIYKVSRSAFPLKSQGGLTSRSCRSKFALLKNPLLVVLVSFLICCASVQEQEQGQRVVTQETYKLIGHEAFANFRFYISKDVTLREITHPDIGPNVLDNVVKITTYDNTINLKSSTPGIVQGEASLELLKIAFETRGLFLRKPTIVFAQKDSDENDSERRYYFKYTEKTVIIYDQTGKAESVHGPVIEYSGKEYLLEFEGSGEPYLLYDEVQRRKARERTMKGLKY
ncbi:MAG: hypothetical protein LBC60_01425 [Spirochaetaceae bacterium]|jgi:hypothetical protein|nr:hypothetical protein [Spirochaetaceae bacterium]